MPVASNMSLTGPRPAWSNAMLTAASLKVTLESVAALYRSPRIGVDEIASAAIFPAKLDSSALPNFSPAVVPSGFSKSVTVLVAMAFTLFTSSTKSVLRYSAAPSTTFFISVAVSELAMVLISPEISSPNAVRASASAEGVPVSTPVLAGAKLACIFLSIKALFTSVTVIP